MQFFDKMGQPFRPTCRNRLVHQPKTAPERGKYSHLCEKLTTGK